MLLLAGAGQARGQVAVPSILPVTLTIGDPSYGKPSVSFVPANPAVIQWGAPKRWGGGTITSQWGLSGATPAAMTGLYLGGVNVGPELSYAGAYLELAEDTSFPSADWTLIAGGVAFQSGDSIAFGASIERTGTIQGSDSLGFDNQRLGISAQLSRAWYAGVALGTESLSSSFSGSGDRSVTAYGIGYRSGGAEHAHFEAYLVERDAAQVYSSTNQFSDSTTTVLVAEVQLGDIVLGGSVSTSAKTQADITTSGVSADAGWAPKRGISLLFHTESATTTVGATGDVYPTTTTTISFAYAF
ncbi:MAG: hypothetical protein V3S29_14400 [bacterium]